MRFRLRVQRTLANLRYPFLDSKSPNFWSDLSKKIGLFVLFLFSIFGTQFQPKIHRFLTQKTTKFSSILYLGKSQPFLFIGNTGFEVRPPGFEVRLINFAMGSVGFEVRPLGFEAVRSSIFLGSTQH